MEKKKIKKKLWGIIMGIGVLLGSTQGFGMTAEVQAAEAFAVTELQVAASDDNRQIMAQCRYQNHDAQSGCIMTLYLYQIRPDDQASIVAYKTIPYAEMGEDSTVPVSVEDGLYLASVGMNYNGMVKQINSEHYYQVKNSDGKVEVTELEEPDQSEDLSHKAEESRHTCSHDSLYYEAVRPATAESDGVQACLCTVCGEIIRYEEIPNSAYASFQQEAIDAIRNAEAEEVIIHTDRWVSFHRTVMEAISEKQNLKVIVRYTYQGKKYEVTIPGGEDVNALVDENGFCGFRYLDQIFDGTPLSV